MRAILFRAPDTESANTIMTFKTNTTFVRSQWLAAAAIALMAMPFAASAENLPWGKSGDGLLMQAGANDAYRPPVQNDPQEGYDAGETGAGDNGAYPDQERPYESEYTPEGSRSPRTGTPGRDYSNRAPPSGGGDGYGEPYRNPDQADQSPPPMGYDEAKRAEGSGYDQGEIVGAGHKFFGGITSGLANAVEYAFKSQGRPNGYILGEDAGGALIVGLRYGEGSLYTKDAGTHKVFWQGPSIGYDAGAEGSKTMVLVYNMRDPSEIYERFGGVQGSAYLVGGVSVQFQKYNDVTLAVIRSGLGLRLGANIGYLKYTRSPTWNPL
jgi:hypothetical protein